MDISFLDILLFNCDFINLGVLPFSLNKIYLDNLYQLPQAFSIVKLSDLANSTIEIAIYSFILRKISEICFSLAGLTKTILFHKFI